MSHLKLQWNPDFLNPHFFKQKTAYEMVVSDWSSDVCSSDLSRLNNGEHSQKIGFISTICPVFH